MEIDILKGKILKDIQIFDDDVDNSIIFITSHNEKYKMCHETECCEEVYIEDIVGDLKDLIGVPIVMAEKIFNLDNPKTKNDVSWIWTFYKLGTVNGYVTIRWYSMSNGNYSETVDFKRI